MGNIFIFNDINNTFFINIYTSLKFQSPITFEMKTMLISLYDIIYFLIIILIFTFWIFYKLIVNFITVGSKKKNSLNSSHCSFRFLGFKIISNNRFQLKLIWSSVPILIFYFIYLPVFKLLEIFGYDDFQESFNSISGEYYNYLTYPNSVFEEDNGCDLYKIVGYLEFLKLKILNNPLIAFNFIKVIGNQRYWMYEINYDIENIELYFSDYGGWAAVDIKEDYDSKKPVNLFYLNFKSLYQFQNGIDLNESPNNLNKSSSTDSFILQKNKEERVLEDYWLLEEEKEERFSHRSKILCYIVYVISLWYFGN